MSKRTLLIVLAALFAVLLGAFVKQTAHAASTSKVSSISEVSIQHTPCYGPCPVYTLTLKSDGTATFVGVAHVTKIGTYTAQFGGFDRLGQAITARRFQELNTRYTSLATDLSHTITTVVLDGKRKAVDNYGDTGPQALWEIQAMIDGVSAELTWKKVSTKRHDS